MVIKYLIAACAVVIIGVSLFVVFERGEKSSKDSGVPSVRQESSSGLSGDNNVSNTLGETSQLENPSIKTVPKVEESTVTIEIPVKEKSQDTNDGALQDQHISGRALQDQHISGRALQDQHISGRAIEDQHISGKAVQTQHISGKAVQTQHISGRVLQTLHISGGSVLQHQHISGG